MKTGLEKWRKRQRIGVLWGGNSPERPISRLTGKAVFDSLKRQGLITYLIDVNPQLPQKLRAKGITFAFLALHGPGGEDGSVQGLLEVLGIPYTGSGVLASALAMDKIVTRQVLQSAGLPVAAGLVWDEKNRRQPDFPLPWVVKPANQGSTLGISIVQKENKFLTAIYKAKHYSKRILLEEFISGRELTVPILADEILPVIEIVPRVSRFYDFRAKYAPGGSRHKIPAPLPRKIYQQAEELGWQAFRALGCRAVARIDIIWGEKQGLRILEVNTIPGMTISSLLPEAAAARGINFDELTWRIIEASL